MALGSTRPVRADTTVAFAICLKERRVGVRSDMLGFQTNTVSGEILRRVGAMVVKASVSCLSLQPQAS